MKEAKAMEKEAWEELRARMADYTSSIERASADPVLLNEDAAKEAGKALRAAVAKYKKAYAERVGNPL